MQVTINGRPATDLPADWEKDIELGGERPEVSGVVLDLDAAAARFLFRFRIVCLVFVVLVWLGLYCMAALAQPGNQAFLATFAWIMAVATPLAFVGIYVLRRNRLYNSLPARVQESPPPGTKIRVDRSGLAIGDRFAAWDDVALDRVNFELIREGRSGRRTYLVHQLAVRTKEFACVLDGLLMQHGAAIVIEIYRRKYPPP
jgi:hypothetical protein